MDEMRISSLLDPAAARDKWLAMRRGFRGRCPHCGKGHIFQAFLKVRNACERCGEEFHHHRSDDAPPYVTLLIVSHIFGFAYVGVMSFYDLSMAVELVLWPTLVLVLCLMLLPRVKGGLIGLQWALRMHGFSGEPMVDTAEALRGGLRSRPPRILTS